MKGEVNQVRQWLTEAALPLWAERGVDRDHGGFVERPTLDANPDLSATKLVRVVPMIPGSVVPRLRREVLTQSSPCAGVANHGRRTYLALMPATERFVR